MPEPADELARLRCRVEQLEAALARRTELLEQRHAELAHLRASKPYKAARLAQKLADRVFPLHTRRRAYLRTGVGGAVSLGQWALNRRRLRNGPPPEERWLSESTPPGEYRRWVARHEPKARDLERQRRHQYAHAPLVSVVVPVYNPPQKYLEAMVQSVRAQTYANWELCLADASDAPHVRPALEKLASLDSRIKVQFLSENLGIAGNSNAALAMAAGEWVGLLDHDDTLAPFALHAVVGALQGENPPDVVYSDEDKLDTAGERVEPNFKPDWSPETLRSRNYVCHFLCLRRTLVEEIGGFRAGFDGSQDYDLILRAGERAGAVAHVPQILYHWRMHAASTALNKGSKNYAFDNGRRALQEHLARVGIDGDALDGPILGTYQVVTRLRSQPLVSVVVPNRDHPEMLARCWEALRKGGYANFEFIVAENGSTLPATFTLYEHMKRDPRVKVVAWDRPFNYAAVNNFAARAATGDYFLFLNNDVESIGPDWLEALVKVGAQPGVGAVGAKLLYADDTIQHAGIVVGMGGVAGHSFLNFPRHAAGYMQRLLYTQNVAAVTGACLLMPAPVFRAVGGFDEGFVLAFNDVDICLQVLAKGYRVVWTPDAELYHLESKTRGPEDTPAKQARFKREIDLFHAKWGDFLKAGDPYYSPHFRLDRPDFALRAA